MSHKPFGRRSFLKSAGATLTTALFTGNLRGANDRPTGAFIGVGMMGTENLKVALDLGVEVRGRLRCLSCPPRKSCEHRGRRWTKAKAGSGFPRSPGGPFDRLRVHLDPGPLAPVHDD